MRGDGGLRKKGYFKSDHESLPLVSIITVVKNGEAYLEEAMLFTLPVSAPIAGAMWKWDGPTQTYQAVRRSAELRPGDGYWIYAEEACLLDTGE